MNQSRKKKKKLNGNSKSENHNPIALVSKEVEVQSDLHRDEFKPKLNLDRARSNPFVVWYEDIKIWRRL